MLTVAQQLAQTIFDNGVRTVFGLPGGEVVELLDAFREAGIEFVLVKNEATAVYMADVTARLTGTIGVVLVTLGPGAANAYAGVAHAYLDRAPVLIITAQTDPKRIGTHSHQVLDLQACFPTRLPSLRPNLRHQAAPETIQFAISQLTTWSSGDQFIWDFAIGSQPARHDQPTPQKQTKQDLDIQHHVIAINALLEKSDRPVIVAGVGLEPERPYPELKALAESLNAPLIDTPKAKGCLNRRPIPSLWAHSA